MTRARIRPLATLILTASLGAGLGGCSNTYGVDIENHTGQNLTVEFLDVAGDGSTRVYSSARLAPKGKFTNRVTSDEQGFGKRVRFSLPDRPPQDSGAIVELKLSEDSARFYDLVLNNGRLMANELKKGRDPTDRADRMDEY